MRVSVYYSNDDIRLEEISKPMIGPREILLKVSMCGICGSDVMEWYRIKKAPKVLGHEVVGIVSESGQEVEKYREGDRVFVSHHVPCDECRFCVRNLHTACETLHTTNIDPGGFAEYVRVPEINVKKGVFSLPEDMTDEEGVFIEPLGCIIRSQDQLKINPNDTILVLGSGVSGILHIQLARLKGVSKIFATDVHDSKLRYAKHFGADTTIDARLDVPQIVRELNEGNPANHVIVSTGAPPAIKQALDSIENGGSILFFAPTPPGFEFPISINDLWSKQITLTTSYAASPSDLMRALELINADQINVEEMVSHKLRLSETQHGFQLVVKGKDSLKVIVEPHN